MISVGAYHKFTVGGTHNAGDILVFCDLCQNQTLLLVYLKHALKYRQSNQQAIHKVIQHRLRNKVKQEAHRPHRSPEKTVQINKHI